MPGRRRLLWADDEIELLTSHILYLEERGYTVVGVSSGEDALALCAAETFDLLLLDERMPGMDGLTVLERLRAVRPDLPVVMVTKQEDEGLMEAAIGRSIADFLTKPVNPSQVLSVCKRLLERERIRDETLARDYTGEFARISGRLAGPPLAPAEWSELVEALAWWSIRLDETGQDGLAESLASLQREADGVFARQVAAEYPAWVADERSWPDRLAAAAEAAGAGYGEELRPPGDPAPLPPLPPQPLEPGAVPVLVSDFLGTVVLPTLAATGRAVLFVLDCLRYDQWLALQPLVTAGARIERTALLSLLPTATPYARNALLSGRFPDEIAAAFPELAADRKEGEEGLNRFEPQMLAEALALTGAESPGAGSERGPGGRGGTGLALFERVRTPADSEALARRLGERIPAGLSVVVVSFLDLLVHDHAESIVVQELAPDAGAFRALAREWFRRSPFPRLIGKIVAAGVPVLIATDHGSTPVSRPVEVKADRTASSGVRYRIGRNLNADPRWTHRIDDLAAWRLFPGRLTDTCLLAREDAFLVFAGDPAAVRRRFTGSFQHGGISPAEMIVPCVRIVRG